MEESLKDAALKLASMGLAIVPLHVRKKEPATEHGLKDYMTDKARLEDWWTKHPMNNIGAVMGEPSGGIICIDIDVDTDKGYDGGDFLAAWENKYGELPETVSAITGRGGQHLFYRVDHKVKPSVNDEIHIDIRGDGSYAMVAPSVHPNGNVVTWENDPEEYDFAPADENVYAFLEAIRSKKDEKPFELPEIIQEHGRNNTLYHYGCQLQAKSVDDVGIRGAIIYTNQARCKPPLPSYEVEKICDSVLTLPKGYSEELQAKLKEKEAEKNKIQIEGFDLDNVPELKPAIIEGVLRENSVMMLGGPSKAGKTFMLMQLAIAAATGTKWLGFQCATSRVLYVNLEVDKAEFLNRFEAVFSSLFKTVLSSYSREEIKPIVETNIRFSHLRGKLHDEMAAFTEDLIKTAKEGEYNLIILDPSYKILDGDENSAKDVHKFTNCLDKIAHELNTTVVYCHHHSKGFKGETRSIDRVSGSGVFARHADAVADCIELDVSDDQRQRERLFNNTCLRIEFTTRSFGKPDSFETVFEYPVHRVVSDGSLADAKPYTPQVKGGKTRGEAQKKEMSEKAKNIESLILESFNFASEVPKSEIVQQAINDFGYSSSAAYRYIEQVIKNSPKIRLIKSKNKNESDYFIMN